MNRIQAQQHLGTNVSAWTALWGIYAGKLIRVTDDKPWRAVVLVEMVIQPPTDGMTQTGGRTWLHRTPYPYHKELEVGGINIKVCTEPLMDYHESLKQALESHIQRVQAYSPQWWTQKVIQGWQLELDQLNTTHQTCLHCSPATDA